MQLEAELNVRSTASSHRTPVLREHDEEVLPHEAVALYHSFAQEQLAQPAVGEQAGSMALYGLGKVYARLAERRDDDVQCTRGAMTMYCAALDACPNNHLAANELGVLLCRTGHPAEAVDNFARAIDIAPSATRTTTWLSRSRSLACRPGGGERTRIAAAGRLGAIDGAVSRRAGVEWVSPAEMARMSQPATADARQRPNRSTAAKPRFADVNRACATNTDPQCPHLTSDLRPLASPRWFAVVALCCVGVGLCVFATGSGPAAVPADQFRGSVSDLGRR